MVLIPFLILIMAPSVLAVVDYTGIIWDGPTMQIDPSISGTTAAWTQYSTPTSTSGHVYIKEMVSDLVRRISQDDVNSSQPHLGNGYIVYTDRSGDFDIYGQSVGANFGNLLLVASAQESQPAVDYFSSSRIAYHGNDGNLLVRLSNDGQHSTISDIDYRSFHPDIDGGRVVYERFNSAMTTSNIYLYVISTGKTITITKSGTARFPKISGTRVIFQDRRSGNWEIYYNDTVNGQETRVTTDGADQVSPDIDGNWIVWTDYRAGNADIYMKNLVSGTIETTSDPANQVNPAISGSLVVWQDYRAGNWDIYYRDLTIPLPTPTPTPKGAIHGITSPAGANMYVDDFYYSITPFTVPNLDPGDRRVNFTLTNYYPTSTWVPVSAGATATISATLVPLPSPKGAIRGVATPQATLFIDSTDRGQTPTTIANLDIGTHGVELVRPGYIPYSTTVAVSPSATVTVSATLSPTPTPKGAIYGDTNPTGATMKVDTVNKGLTPTTAIDLAIGIRNVEFTKTGYLAYATTVPVVASATATVSANLVPTPTPKGAIRGISNPQATLFIDGSNRGQTPTTIASLDLGPHDVNMTRPGYIPYVTTVAVSPSATVTVSATLVTPTPTPKGAIRGITSPTGANLSIDSSYRGLTPTTIANLDLGNHLVEFMLLGHIPFSTTVPVLASATATVSASLSPTPTPYGSIHGNTTPFGASMFVDTILRGLTPFTVDNLNLGNHLVNFTMPGFFPFATTVPVVVSATATIHANLIPTPTPQGSIRGNTTPTGASMFVDTVYKGLTPFTAPNITTGNHAVLFNKTSYLPYSTTVPVVADTTAIISATLTPESAPQGSIHGNTLPSNASMQVDSVFKGMTPFTVSNLSVGNHTVDFNKTGYVPYSTTVPVVASATATVSISLVATPTPTPTPKGSIRANSTPINASFIVDSILRGLTPLVVSNLDVGNHLVVFNLTGYLPFTTTVPVNASATTAIFVNLTLMPTPTPGATATPPPGGGGPGGGGSGGGGPPSASKPSPKASASPKPTVNATEPDSLPPERRNFIRIEAELEESLRYLKDSGQGSEEARKLLEQARQLQTAGKDAQALDLITKASNKANSDKLNLLAAKLTSSWVMGLLAILIVAIAASYYVYSVRGKENSLNSGQKPEEKAEKKAEPARQAAPAEKPKDSPPKPADSPPKEKGDESEYKSMVSDDLFAAGGEQEKSDADDLFKMLKEEADKAEKKK